MQQQLAQWLSTARIRGVDQSQLNARATVIESLKKKDLAWQLDCLRIFLGKPSDNTTVKGELIQLFTAQDSYFPQTKNELELRILSGAIVWNQCMNLKTKEKSVLLQLLRTGVFGVAEGNLVSIDLISELNQALIEESISIREGMRIDNLKAAFETSIPNSELATINAKLVNINDALAKIVNHINISISKKVSLIEEESNIHWWLFRGLSDLRSKKFSEVDPINLPFIVALELSEWTVASPGPFPSKQFIAGIYDAIPTKLTKISIKDFVSDQEDAEVEKYISQKNQYSNLCPLTFAFYLKKNSSTQSDWVENFKSKCGLPISNKFDSKELAFQLYNEIVAQKFN